MKLSMGVFVTFLAAVCTTGALAQKVRVGYDKSVDFSKYATYTWSEPGMPATRPLLYATIVASIDQQLQSKGLTRLESGGDLILMPAGGIEFGLNHAAGTPYVSTYSGPPPVADVAMWTGAGPASLMATYVPQGTLELNVVDRSANKVVWTGTVQQKLDLEKKQKSLQLADKAMAKLLKDFPPKKK